MRRTTLGIALIILHGTLCSSQSESNFLMYDKNVNKCLKGYQPLKLFYCDSNQLSQQFRWTSNNRIFNVYMKKCLGAGSKEDGSGLQWYICDDTSDLQKWECKNATMLNLKGTNLYLSQDENTILKLTQDIGAASQWLIHGTSEGLCSQPYQALYTIEGTAFGRPCHFPFQYKGKWYSDCVLRESSKRLWCSTDRDYQERWGYCPTMSTDHWKKNPVTGIFYQININSALTWHQARSSCQQQDSDLLSITEPQEQTFISGITSEVQTTFWIGLNQLNTESGWQWADRSPFCYLRWGSGQPNPALGWNCASLNTMQTHHWENKLCSKKHGYICQKRTTVPATATPGPPVSCSAPWIPYTGHCYFLNRTKNTWKDASTQCMNAGGHLVSIRNIEEQSFVLSQLGYMETDKLWIGLNDQKTQLLFEWSDQSPVTFTTWDAQEPSHHRSVEEDCVLMGGKDGKWADVNCGEKNGFICKRAGDSKSSSGSETENTGCQAGWTRYGYNCYFVGSTTKTFDEAKKSCQETGAHLIDISNRIENAFLISLVGARPEKHFWIGLSNLRDRHTFEWTNTQNVPYTHWNTHMPGQKQGCVAMRTGLLAGLWDVLSCSYKEKYICKHQAEGVVTTPAPPTSPTPSCAEGWKPIGVRNFCYKFYEMEYEEQKTWFAALDFCRSIGGDLISIHSHLDNLITGTSWHAWIGYSAQDPSVGYAWSDGTASSYTNWKSEEPDNKYNMENCVGIEMSSLEWEDRGCELRDDFICEIRKGVTPKNPANFTIPEYNVTEDGWIEFSGHQYYISSDYYNVDAARTFCRKGHGELVSINTESERLFLWKQIASTYTEFLIGLEIDWDLNMQWMDGTPVVFLRWDERQPPDEILERCVVMAFSYGLWSVVNCGTIHRFICERHEAPAVNATLAPTEAPKGGCAPDWMKYKQHCYKTEFSLKTWKEALLYCRAEGGSLVSIQSQEEQAFLTTMMLNAPGDLWIGMKNWFSSVLWSDGKVVLFTNFKHRGTDGYQDLYPYWHRFNDEENICYKMIFSPRLLTGKWRPAICNDTYGYICKKGIDSHIVPQTTVLPQSYVKFGNDSLKVEPNNLTWWEAKKRCEKDGAQLASIRDGLTQAFIELQIEKLKQPMWVGLNKNETDGYFRWIEGWPLNLVNWKNEEPQAHFPCAYVDIEGYWKTAPCDQSLPSVCKKSTDIAPTPNTRYLGACPETTEDATWFPFRGYCYMLSYNQENAGNALTTCSRRGASLLSIEDAEEAKFINGMLEMVQDTYGEIWIGLYKNFRGQWHWFDRSVLDYTNWAEGYPEEDDDHAWISTSDFKWRSGHSYTYNSYICKTAKVPIPASFTAKPAPQDAPHSFALAVVVIIVVVVVLVGIAAFIYYKGYKPALPNHPTFENPMYYKVLNPAVPDTKTLIHDTELE